MIERRYGIGNRPRALPPAASRPLNVHSRSAVLIRVLFTSSVALAGLALLPSCADLSGPESDRIAVSGSLSNVHSIPIPEDARVVIAWTVTTASPEYSYVFGDGTVDRVAGTFRIELIEPPPTEALNADGFGIGVIFLTTDDALKTGDDISDIPEAEILGAAGEYGVVYATEGAGGADSQRPWLDGFAAGYSVGRGVSIPGQSFDGFEPASPDIVEIIIDSLDDIPFVNWT